MIGLNSKHAITHRIGRYFVMMIAVVSFVGAISLSIMWSNQSDAYLINISGSLRMQSYRLLYEMEHHPETLPERLQTYRDTLDSPTLRRLSHEYLLPDHIIESYQQLEDRWQIMETFVHNGNTEAYIRHIEEYAEQVNRFVFDLQEFVELKLKIAISAVVFSILLMILLAYFAIWYIRRRIIVHLDQLVIASQQVQNKDFDHIQLAINEPNELGLLSAAFTQMANELSRFYVSLEEKVEDKTRRLLAVNRSLLMLYQCSTLFSTKQLSRDLLYDVLKRLAENEQLRAIKISIDSAEHWNIVIDNDPLNEDWQQFEIAIENEKLATLYWKTSLLCVDQRLIQNVAEMIGRNLYIIQAQKQQQQLLLMEERAIIARELHDSLAQSLTFFKIQVSLLKRNSLQEQDWHKAQKVLNGFETALNEAYSQLRELLATFRLTIQEAHLTRALESMLENLRPQTTASINLNCQLPSQMFNAQQQIHVLQIVREAVINAIKHANATLIEVIAASNNEGEPFLIIRDNGKGLGCELQPEGHYGLTIMKERTQELGGEFFIYNHDEGGVEVKVQLANLCLKT